MATHWRGPLYIVKSDGSFVQFVDENGEIVANVDLGDINDSNGNEMLELDAVASAVNYFRFANSATGNAIVLSARGDDDNVSIQLTGKGTGYVGLGQATSTDVRLLADQPIADSSGNELIKFVKTASAVNELTITNNSTGLGPTLTATGETNVPITLAGKGTGYVGLGQSTSTDVRLVADQPIADSSGNELIKFVKTASAVNEVTISNNSTGLGPTLLATGETNVPITIGGKGTGYVGLGQATTTDVRLVADQPIADSSGNEFFKFTKTASAVNELTLANGATAGSVLLTVTGSDTVVCDFTLTGKAAGAATVVGGAVTLKGGAGNTSGAGGLAALTGGAGGDTGVGGGLTLVTGAGGTTSGASGAVIIGSGTTANATTTTASASGDISIRVGAPGTATTGTGGAAGTVSILGRTGGASTGAAGTAGVGSSVVVTAGNGGASSGGTDTAGNGGNLTLTAGNGGAGTTPGRDGGIFMRLESAKGVYFKSMPVPAAKTTNATLTVSEVLGGWVTVDGSGSATSTQTTPTGTELVAACPTTLAAGDCFDFRMINISTDASETAILAGGTDVTIVGSAIVSDNATNSEHSSGTFRFRYSGANVWVVYRA